MHGHHDGVGYGFAVDFFDGKPVAVERLATGVLDIGLGVADGDIGRLDLALFIHDDTEEHHAAAGFAFGFFGQRYFGSWLGLDLLFEDEKRIYLAVDFDVFADLGRAIWPRIFFVRHHEGGRAKNNDQTGEKVTHGGLVEPEQRMAEVLWRQTGKG